MKKSKWRLKTISHLTKAFSVDGENYSAEHWLTSYVFEKKLFGFLWWHNPDNFDGHCSGIYRNREDAMRTFAIRYGTSTRSLEEVTSVEVK